MARIHSTTYSPIHILLYTYYTRTHANTPFDSNIFVVICTFIRFEFWAIYLRRIKILTYLVYAKACACYKCVIFVFKIVQFVRFVVRLLILFVCHTMGSLSITLCCFVWIIFNIMNAVYIETLSHCFAIYNSIE